MKPAALLLAMLLSLGAAPAAVSASWAELSPAQRQTLAPLASQWSGLDAASQDTWAAIALRYPGLSAPEQARLRDRMQQWASLSPAARDQVRRGYAQAQRVPPEDRAAKWERFQALPPERKQALAERAAARRQAASAPPAPPTHPLQSARAQVDERTLLPRRVASAP